MTNKRDNRKMTDADADSGDFAAMLASYDAVEHVTLQPGEKVKGRIFHISKENVFVEISGTQEGVLPRAEVLDDTGRQTVALGDQIEAYVAGVDGGIVLTRKLGRDGGGVEMLTQAKHSGMPVEGVVTAANKGGLEVSLGTLRGFCPMGQVDLNFVDDPQQYIGKTLQFVVKEIKERGRNIVLSRRSLLEAERAIKLKALRSSLQVGQRLNGTVTRVAAFGAFVDLGGIDGLIPISELSHERVKKVEDAVHVGDVLEVEIRSIEEDPHKAGQLRISLSRKNTLSDPWDSHAHGLTAGSLVVGRVVKLEAFGAFVQLFPGVDGLIHISEMSHQRVRHPQDILKINTEVNVRILSIDHERRRLSLSLREAGQTATPGADTDGDMRAGAFVDATVERCESYGVIVKLPNGATALLPAGDTGTARGTDLKRVFPQGAVLALQVTGKDDNGRWRVSKTARERSEEQSVVSDYQRASQASGGGFGKLGDLLMKKQNR